jgi:hypothetical protein
MINTPGDNLSGCTMINNGYCLFTVSNNTATSIRIAANNTTTISGTVQLGGTQSIVPIANADVIIYKTGQSTTTIVGSATTDSSGKFYINIPNDQASA